MSVPPGWYRDPAEPTVQRWWDGEGWVGDRLPADATPPPAPPTGSPPAGRYEPQVPAVPGIPGAAEPPVPGIPGAAEPGHRPEGQLPGARVPAGWPYHRPEASPAAPPPQPHGYPLATLGSRLMARLVDIGLVLALNVAVNGWFVYQFWTEISPVLGEAWRRSVAGESMSGLPAAGDAGNLQLVILVLAAALWFAYEVPAIANTGQTPGKRLLRIKVVRLEEPSARHASSAAAAPARLTSSAAAAPARLTSSADRAEPLGFGRSFRRWNTMGLPTLLWWCFGIGFVLQLVDVMFVLFDRPLQQALHDKSAYTVVISVAAGAPSSPEETPDEPADPS